MYFLQLDNVLAQTAQNKKSNKTGKKDNLYLI
jgi:hypothetical protein